MCKLKLLTLKVPETRRLLMVGLLILVGLLTIYWRVQQNNLYSLYQKLNSLQQEIEKLPATVAPKDKLALKKDLLLIEKDRVNAQNAIYGTLVQALGGVFFFVTAYFTWRSVKTAEANLRATEEKQVTERFSKAVEQLGSEKLAVRLGGIYALERIARDSEKDHWTIMEVLTSFVQENSPMDSQEQLKPVTADVQAALTVIGRRDYNQDQKGRKLDLSDANLAKANFRGAYLKEAYLRGTDLRKANLEEADFTKVYLGEANLSEANLSGANLSSKANLSGANLSNVNCRTNLPVKKVNLTQALLIQANLTGAILPRANLSDADLSQANLKGAHLYQAKLIKAKLGETDLSGADFSLADLSKANLSGANMCNTNLHKTTFFGAEGLTEKQIKAAKDWEHADYDENIRKALGLASESAGGTN